MKTLIQLEPPPNYIVNASISFQQMRFERSFTIVKEHCF